MNTTTASTPCYVLMDGNHRIGPSVFLCDSGAECESIYGFSDKTLYDRFRTNDQLSLKPYPLVQGYLRGQIATAGHRLQLVVMNAVGPRQPDLHAATMAAVLEAQEKRTSQVATSYRLIFDPEANTYRAAILD